MPNIAAHDPLTAKVEDFPSHEAVTVSVLPSCDICVHVYRVQVPERALFDGKTNGGPWANMCGPHFNVWGIGLGLGLGQRLLTPPITEPSR